MNQSVEDVFYGQILALMATARAAGESVTSGAQRTWAAPIRGAWSGNPLDVAGMTAAFDRSSLGQKFEGIVLDPQTKGTVGDVIALVIQNDYVAARERAFRLRHISPVRAACHAAARRKGHGDAGGVFGNGVLRYVQDVLRQGGSQ